MLYDWLFNTASSYPDKSALNNHTYSELIKRVDQHAYSEISNNQNIILDVFKASKLNKPLIILPKNISKIILPKTSNKFELIMYSSGTLSNIQNPIKITEQHIITNAQNAIESQFITENDTILTVCSLNHTGGLNAQTIPAILQGCHVIIEPFDVRTFFASAKKYKITITHLIPKMAKVLMRLKSTIDHKFKVVTCGSDCVDRNMVEFFLSYTDKFIINYGLTQAGPIIINHKFDSSSDLSIFNKGVVLGSQIWCDYKICDNELLLKGKNISTEQVWLSTDDCIDIVDNFFIYKGRKSAGCKIIPKRY